MAIVWKRGSVARYVHYIEHDGKVTHVRLFKLNGLWQYTVDHRHIPFAPIPDVLKDRPLEDMQAWVTTIWRME